MAVGDDRNDEVAVTHGPARARVPGGTCAIAGVRGDVTTMRAAQAVEARRRTVPPIGRDRLAPEKAGDVFPIRLLDVGPA